MHIQSFDITLQYLPGSKNFLADALSRNPVATAFSHSSLPYSESVEHSICFILQKSPVDLKSVATATACDSILQAVILAIGNDWKNAESRRLMPYYSFRDELSLKLCSNSTDSIVVSRPSYHSPVVLSQPLFGTNSRRSQWKYFKPSNTQNSYKSTS